ncbi:hypothetical protein RvY_08008 [Ramazzottius varieornatus]|uniref:Uncharacterized protein n=1 Tax=Ramazzottius varieornatus TaxID=947166 RepID=A0A1D1V6S3_RAMVA|nr:hypothetical protein RvY_08008 [Ramazzottius varieornatus]
MEYQCRTGSIGGYQLGTRGWFRPAGANVVQSAEGLDFESLQRADILDVGSGEFEDLKEVVVLQRQVPNYNKERTTLTRISQSDKGYSSKIKEPDLLFEDA